MGLFGKKQAAVEPTTVASPAETNPALENASHVEQVDESKAAAKTPKKKIKKSGKGLNVFAVDTPGDKPLQDPDREHKRYMRLVWRIHVQSIIISCLVFIFMAGTQVLQVGYQYYARRIGAPLGTEKRIIELNLPVLTSQAIISWSMSTVTEVLTFNFANYNQRISMFASRFHPQGWKAFAKAMYESRTIQGFTQSQLVATATPSEPATIEFEGENPETLEYEWHIKVPVIRTFVTNNDKNTTRRSDIYLTIIRMPLTESPAGMAIKVWQER